MRPTLASWLLATAAALAIPAFSGACGRAGSTFESRPLTTQLDAYRTGTVELIPAKLEGGAKEHASFVAYLEASLKKNGVIEPLPADAGAQLTIRVRAASDTVGEDDVKVLVDFVDARNGTTLGQITVSGNALGDKGGAALRRVADEIVSYMRVNRRAPPSANAFRAASDSPPPAAPAAGVVASGGCTTTCTPDTSSSLPPEELTRVAEAAQPMLKAVRGCLDQVSAQAIHPAALLRFEGAGQVTKLKIDAGGYDELACVEEARARGLRVGISRGASVRCVFRCN